jgi:hypothetical protein
MPAEMRPITSTNIAAAGIDPDSDYPLVVEFVSGGVYSYPGDESDVAALEADSKYFQRSIKPRPFRRLS